MTTSPTHRSGKALALSLVAIFIAAGLTLAGWWFYGRTGGNEERQLITTTVVSGPYEHVLTEQGTVENASYHELKCEVRSRGQGGIAIINVLPEGTLVEPGDLVVELDSSMLEQERVTQLIQVTGQRALLTQAENQLAAAQIARREYEQGTFVQEERLLIADAYVVQQTLSNAETALEAAKKLFDRAVITAKQVESATFAVEDARNRLLATNTKLENLRVYAKEKMLKTYDSNIATASADVSASQARLALEERKLKDIEDQIEKCTIRAPVAGEVIHANEYDSDNGNIETDFLVQAGAVVRERQTIVNLPKSNEMQIRATVGQARVTLVRPGMPVTIRVDALKDQLIEGEVTKVNQYADPSNWSNGNIKKYATYIKVHDPPPGLRGGMIAEVRIQIDQRPEALQVPVQALAQHKGRYFSLVKNGDNYDTREVRVASTNDKVAVIDQGVALGDVLVMSPRRAGGLLDLPELPDVNPATVAGKQRPRTSEVQPNGANKESQREPAQPAGGGE